MGAVTQWIFAVMWLILSAFMAYLAIKHDKFLFVPSALFLFMGGWFIADIFIGADLLYAGKYSLIFRCVALVALIVCGIRYYMYKKSSGKHSGKH